MAAPEPGREEEEMRQGKVSGKGEWGEDESDPIPLSLSSLVFGGNHDEGVT